MTVLATDTFNRVNENPLTATFWTVVTGRVALQVVSTACEPGSVNSADAAEFYSGISWPNDGYAQVVVTTANTSTSNGVGAIYRCASAANTFYRVRARGPLGASATLDLFRVVAGVTGSLGTTTTTINSGDTIKIICSGTNISAYVNGSLIIGPIVDSNIASGSAGAYAFEATAVTDAVLDNFEGGNLLSAIAQTPPMHYIGR